ncbi:Oidioi.mRNA.OKI2018_I69.chr1.g1705.t1.cds [Oikopleura dioica]|uniref:Sulfotransferase n=1 Tax=Oikopleura dioica TaxID=34765 RepID=A0ABN7SXW9_OIKDI|nr:Oidioi.mRNA.OKI2018_I69.chr1.g1705.t1.cds [Oikopleura dioica]
MLLALLFSFLIFEREVEGREKADESEYGDEEYEEYAVNEYSDISEKRFPKAIIVGVRKCGTRALLQFCGLHPQIVHAEREIHFFNDKENFQKGTTWYRQQMPLSLPSQVTMEKTPGYFISADAPNRLKELMNKGYIDNSIKGARKMITHKIILVVRDPVDRIVSSWAQILENRVKKGLPPPSETLEDRILNRGGRVNRHHSAVRTSIYLKWYRNWHRLFRGRILVIDANELVEYPWKSVQKVEDFLELPNLVDESEFYFNSTRGFYCMNNGKGPGRPKCLNKSKGREHPPISTNLRKKLKQFFYIYNNAFFKKINQDFGWNRN